MGKKLENLKKAGAAINKVLNSDVLHNAGEISKQWFDIDDEPTHGKKRKRKKDAWNILE